MYRQTCENVAYNVISKEGGNEVDPFMFGIVSTAVFGGSLVVLGLLGKEFKINDVAIRIVVEAIKAGAILHLFKVPHCILTQLMPHCRLQSLILAIVHLVHFPSILATETYSCFYFLPLPSVNMWRCKKY